MIIRKQCPIYGFTITTIIVISFTIIIGSTLAFKLPSLSKPSKVLWANKTLFIDELGRSRIFRGTNVVYKAFPYHPNINPDSDPKHSFNQVDIDILASHGVTVIRLGVMWPGVEPIRGHYDFNYIEIMRTIVERCQDAGIYVLIDFHQDGLSEKFCGEGIPLWASQPAWSLFNLFGFPFPLESTPYKLNDLGIPSDSDCSKHFYDLLELSYASGSAYQRLYKNYNGLRDSFVAYWKLLAEVFGGFDNVLGYDLMNEPFAGNVFSNPWLIIPGLADSWNLQTFYDVTAEGIRQVDSRTLIFFESVTWDNFAVGFRHPPGGNQYANKTVLSFHHYNPKPNLMDISGSFVERLNDMHRLGCGGMLTEFEMGWKNGANVEPIRSQSQTADRYLFSYTGWEYTDYVQITGTNNGLRDPETGQVRPDMANVYSRTYATAISGTPLSMKFDDPSE
ncbi:hypothetical protein HDU76_002727 [Blyttiomyces sp. JEL0837]|nr:hypothetical protein HDU76_002727 [Blyttiomyces sp. JEL0837]